MDCSPYSFEKLPFSRLYCDYIQQTDSIADFFAANPFDDSSVKDYAETLAFVGDREKSVEALTTFNRRFGAGQPVLDQIEKLNDERSLAVVTGQQLTLYGGPLFTIYKILTAIIYARRWEGFLGRPVVPVFWMADEDHDYDEATHVGIFTSDDWQELVMNGNENEMPVGRRVLGPEFATFEKAFQENLPESDFTPDLLKSLKNHYKEESTFRDAFGKWLMEIFGKHGLILAGSDDPAIKRLTFPPLLKAAEQHETVFANLDEQSKKLETSGFHRQAVVQSSNIFYLDKKGERQKLEFDKTVWHSGNGNKWKSAELAETIEATPENFSPNVFLRPLMQDRLVPTIAYVSGPGEIAYYAQMKKLYEMMDQSMPVVIPRFSVSLLEPAIDRVMQKLPFELTDFRERIEDLESAFVEKSGGQDIEGIFEDWKQRVRSVTDEKVKEITDIDPTLESAADKAGSIFENELNALKGKVYRAIKKDEEIQINRLRRVKENLFPGGNLQERQVAFVCYMNKYGVDLWDRLLTALEDEEPDSHKIVRL